MGFVSDIFKGLTGGGSDKAFKAAQAAEEQRQAEIAAAQKRIESIFGSPQREQQVQDFIAARRGLLQDELRRAQDVNARQTRFATARSGLAGGSVDVDRQRLLAETFLRGIAESERGAQNAGAELRSQDQQAKQQLLSQLLAGGDVTTTGQNASQIFQNSAALNKQDAVFNAFDRLFGDFGDIFKQSREAAGERRASREFGSLFGPRPRTQSQVAGGI